MTQPSGLAPDVVASLARLRLGTSFRVIGHRDGAHRSSRLGSSLEFADQRPYVAGDDPRTVDLAASRRLGRLLVRVYEAEDDTSLRVIVDASTSMAFGGKRRRADEIALALAHVTANGGDRIRVLTATAGNEPAVTPWLRGRMAPIGVAHGLAATTSAQPDLDQAPGGAPLRAAIARAHGEGPRGPVVLVSDLLLPDWTDIVDALGAGPGDAAIVHLLGVDDLAPSMDGDLELVDAETGATVAFTATHDLMDAYLAGLAAWRTSIVDHAATRGVAVAATDDRADLAELVGVTLASIGVVT